VARIKITMDVDIDWADSGHSTGVTNEGYERIIDALNAFGEDIDISAVES
jgi:hypothetical protein